MQNLTATIPGRATPRITLDALSHKTYDELEAMYLAATVPGSLHAADGKLVGRMLAVRKADRGLIARWLRRLARSPSFLWQGKTLAARSDTEGEGYNRVCVEHLLGRQHVFPLGTRFGRSQFDGKPTIIVDYDRPANPGWMRRVHDEIRQLEPGLFLGLDMWKTARGSIGLVWFALDGRNVSN